MDILISGASVAGPCLAHWLHRHGHRPTIVERAPALLAGELDLARGDHEGAFHRYEERMHPHVATCQKQASGSPEYLVPASWKKINERNRSFRTLRYLPPVKHLLTWMATRTATAIKVPSYPPAKPAQSHAQPS